MIGLKDIMDAISSGNCMSVPMNKDENPPNKPDPYSCTKMLLNFDLQKIKNPFKPGDFITPYEDAPINGAGEPHLVIAAFESVQLHITDMSRPLACYNLLVSQVMANNKINIYAVMSVDFEHYKGLTFDEVDLTEDV